MATTFIDYKDHKGFYIAEIFMQLTWHYVNQEIVKNQYSFTNKQKLLWNLHSGINGFDAGYLVLTWDTSLANTTEEQIMVQVLQNVKITLQSKGAYITVEELQAIPTEDEDFKIFYRDPFPTAELVKILDALIQMLQGTWTSTDYNMEINYKY